MVGPSLQRRSWLRTPDLDPDLQNGLVQIAGGVSLIFVLLSSNCLRPSDLQLISSSAEKKSAA